MCIDRTFKLNHFYKTIDWYSSFQHLGVPSFSALRYPPLALMRDAKEGDMLFLCVPSSVVHN